MSILYFNIVAHHVAIYFIFLTLADDGRDVHVITMHSVVNHKAMKFPVHATLIIMLRKGTSKTLKTNLIDHELLPTPKYIKTFEKLIKS